MIKNNQPTNRLIITSRYLFDIDYVSIVKKQNHS